MRLLFPTILENELPLLRNSKRSWSFEVSADPLKDDLQAKLATIKFGAPDSCTDQLDSILSNASICGSDLTKTVLADKVKAYFKAEIAGPGAVRKTLHDAVNA